MSSVITSMFRTVWRPWNFIIDVAMMSRYLWRFRQPFTTVWSSIMYRPMRAGR